ncbi:hypothetical protein FLAG1_08196 [Fusarium langsethiae]|uniref:DUF5071 domain-containing protein n=1 Tax=Fusarium langsethiae TaxID=179993 RepID=A0A0M9ESG0_FUSLA|nr:hypothetical protein FLAG1_08196 [Fusarium langsethiae]GKU05859.1 unnamed protein product [Fusarium langsethiae]GKU21324.1 unnamed protein product [Fusarium langsethiae]
MDVNKKLATLDGETFAAEIPAILQATCDADNDEDCDDSENECFSVIRLHAMESPVIKSLSTILASPIEDSDFASLEMHQLVLYSIISKLSLEQLQPYRPAIQALMEFDISFFKTRTSHYAQTMHLINNARLLDRFIQNPEDIWVPENKFDYIAYRTLWERVHTADQMRPYMHDLFNWQVDQCHPPFKPCREQLARFPEVSAAVAAEVMSMAIDDVEHQHYLINFVSECVPVGKAWYPMRAPVEQMARALESKNKKQLEHDGEEDYLDEANIWLEVLEKWERNT